MKVDCHRHLGGCINPQFVWHAIQKTGSYYLAEIFDDVLESLTFGPHEARGFQRFLDKFTILDKIKWTEELIDESIKSVSDDLIEEGIDYVWMRFSINKYVAHLDWHRRDAISFIHQCFEKYAPGRVGLILSIKYESEHANQRQIARLIEIPSVADVVDGIDLVGNEEYFDAHFYRQLLEPWNKAGKRLFAHVGESQPVDNIFSAIDIGVTDICHGIKIVEYIDGMPVINQRLVDLALEGDICFHMAITSNALTGVIPRTFASNGCGYSHPIVDLLPTGVKITVGTDDPVQCSNTLDLEYERAEDLLQQARYSPKEIDDFIEILRQNAINRVSSEGNILVGKSD